MARPIPTLGPIQVVPDGGGTFNPLADQPMASRSGDLSMLATTAMVQCQEGPRDEGPVPGTGMGEGGVQDTESVDMWIQNLGQSAISPLTSTDLIRDLSTNA